MVEKNLSSSKGKGNLSLNKNNSLLNMKILIFIFLISGEKIKILSQDLYEIALIIEGNGNGYQPIIYDGYYAQPYQVFVNGEEKTSCIKTCDLPEGQNTVILKFNNEIDTCTNMFHDLNNIKEIDLSNFDVSHVENIDLMFGECSNLEKVNFGNIDTSSVQNMYGLFQGC